MQVEVVQVVRSYRSYLIVFHLRTLAVLAWKHWTIPENDMPVQCKLPICFQNVACCSSLEKLRKHANHISRTWNTDKNLYKHCIIHVWAVNECLGSRKTLPCSSATRMPSGNKYCNSLSGDCHGSHQGSKWSGILELNRLNRDSQQSCFSPAALVASAMLLQRDAAYHCKPYYVIIAYNCSNWYTDNEWFWMVNIFVDIAAKMNCSNFSVHDCMTAWLSD